MYIQQSELMISTQGRKMYKLDSKIAKIIKKSTIKTGLCHIFIQHTSASLLITENADPDVHLDLETIISRFAPDGDPAYFHSMEGIDDMSAHARCMVTQTETTIPIINGQLGLGTWQSLYLWEHRTHSLTRSIILTIKGH